MVGTHWGSVMHNTGFLGGEPWLLMSLNKDTTRFLFFVSSANKPVPCWRGLLRKEEREENAALCSQSHQTRSAVAPVGRLQQEGAPAGRGGLRRGVRYKKQGLICGFAFPRKKKLASHIPSHLLELSLDCSERRTWSLPSSCAGPRPLGLRRNLPECAFYS